MIKFLITALAVSMLTSMAHGSINLDFRADYNSTEYKDDADTIPGSARFYLKTGRIDYKGKLNEDLSFRARWAFNKNATVATKDNTTTAIELAYLEHKFNDSFSLQLGKVNSEIGGFETGTSSADLYLTSENYTRSTISRATPSTLTNLQVLYMTGVKGTFNFEGQNIHVLLTDNTSDTTSAAPSGATISNQNRGMMGLAWKGSFLEKTLGTVLSYYEASPNGGNGDDKHTWISGGVKYDMSPVTAYIEYHSANYKDGASGDNNTLTSIVFKAAYTGFEEWTPYIEYFNSEDKREIGTATTDKYNGYGFVAEWAPKKENTFRYHLAYNIVNEELEEGTKYTKNEFVVGARLMADFLK